MVLLLFSLTNKKVRCIAECLNSLELKFILPGRKYSDNHEGWKRNESKSGKRGCYKKRLFETSQKCRLDLKLVEKETM